MAYIKANHYPDFVFNRGIHNETPQSKHMIFPINDTPYPEPGNCIASGCLYRVSNKAFLQTIINFRKSCWLEVELYKTACKNENIPYMRIIEKRIKPEDYQLWDYLARHFKDGVYTSLFIPEILIHHGPERSLYHYL